MTIPRYFVYAVVLTATLALAGSGCAHREPTPEERLHEAVQDLAHQLRLDASQEEKLELLADAWRAGREKVESEGAPLLEDLFASIESARWDESLLTRLRAAGRVMTDDVGPQVIGRLTEFYASLSREQKDRFAEWLKRL